MNKDKGTKWSYDPVAKIYEKIAYIYSFGLIRKAKLSQISEISPLDKVLYVGVGSGEDAVCAAKIGAEVTCIDISSRMIEKSKNKFSKQNLKARFICMDITQYVEEDYDIVIANFFLNNFTNENMKIMLSHLVKLIKPGGRLMIADFKFPADRVFQKIIQSLNFRVAVFFFWILRVAPLHKMFDYTLYFNENNLNIKKVKTFRLLSKGPELYESIIAVKH